MPRQTRELAKAKRPAAIVCADGLKMVSPWVRLWELRKGRRELAGDDIKVCGEDFLHAQQGEGVGDESVITLLHTVVVTTTADSDAASSMPPGLCDQSRAAAAFAAYGRMLAYI